MHHLVGVALQQVVSGATAAAKLSAKTAAVRSDAGTVLAPVLSFLQSRFSDQSSRLTAAIEAATDRAWRALELVLAGDSVWERLARTLASGDMKAFRADVRALVRAAGGHAGDAADRAAALELRAARRAGLLRPAGLTPAGMANAAGAFARFADPSELAAAQWQATDGVAEELRSEGFSTLAAVITHRPSGDSLPLLAIAVRYFFRQAVEQDPELARGLAFAKLEALGEAQKTRFEALNRLVTDQVERLDDALGELAAEVAEVKAVALDVRAEQDRLGGQNRQILEAVLGIQAKLDQVGRAAVRPQDSLSLRTDGERDLVKKVISEYRALPEAARRARPALRNAIGMLEVASGDFAAARSDFVAVAEQVNDPVAKGEAHMNAYRAALEARDWAAAFREVVAAVKHDGGRFAPFPTGKYVPQQILGAGGFGVAFLCKHKYMDAQVVVKALADAAGRDFEGVFTEARAASAVQHPGIVRVTDCGFTDTSAKARPFLVMDYFPGQTLDEYVRQHGPLTVEAIIPLAVQLAEALRAAHSKHILHRDVKPGNVLVRPHGGGIEARVIDFGLAIRRPPRASDGSTSRSAKTLAGESIAGTLEYAAPEQIGRGGGVVGPPSDVYCWAKTCCFALFQTPQPTLRHWQCIPPALAELLGMCLEERPGDRVQSFDEVLALLDPGPDGGAAPLRVGGVNRTGRKLLLALTAVTAVAVGLVWGLGRKPDRPPQVGFAKPVDPAAQVAQVGQAAKPVPEPQPRRALTPSELVWPGGAPVPRPELPRTWRSTPALGGTPTATGMENYAPRFTDGSYLIGFEVGTDVASSHRVISFLRPIWGHSTSGELSTGSGVEYGTRPASGTTVVKAREGYALGGVVVAGGTHLEGICFTFLKIEGRSLNPNEWYVSDWYGEPRRKPPTEMAMRAGDGSPVTGIRGQRFTGKDGNPICTIGLIIAPQGELGLAVRGSWSAMASWSPTTKPFMDFAPEGGQLVGVEIEVESPKDQTSKILRGVRPVYRVDTVESFGAWHPPLTANRTTETVRLVARPGFAVGGMTINLGRTIEGFSVTFMKVAPAGHLSVRDRYESEWVGKIGNKEQHMRPYPTGREDEPLPRGIDGTTDGGNLTGLGLRYRD